MTDEQWQEVIDVHLSAAFKLTRAAGRILKRLAVAESFYLICIRAVRNFGQSNYAAAKMGMYGLARSISMEGGRSNITCNCVAPVGATTMNSGHWSERDKEIRKAEYVAPLVAYLAHSSCEESGSFSNVSWKLQEVTMGAHRGPESLSCGNSRHDRHIAENWQTITNFELTEHPKSMATRFRECMHDSMIKQTGGTNLLAKRIRPTKLLDKNIC